MREEKLYTLTHSGQMLGIGRQTVAEITRLMKIEPRRMDVAGVSKGLTMAEIRRIGRTFGIKVDTEAGAVKV